MKRELGLTKNYKCEVDYVPRKDSEEEISEQLDVKVHHRKLLQEVAGACRKLLQADEGSGDVELTKLTRLIVDCCAFNDQQMVTEIERTHAELKAEKLFKYAAQFMNRGIREEFVVEEVHKAIKVTAQERVQAIMDCIEDLPQQMQPCPPAGRELERWLCSFMNAQIRKLTPTASVRTWVNKAMHEWCLSRPHNWNSTTATFVICMGAGKKQLQDHFSKPCPCKQNGVYDLEAKKLVAYHDDPFCEKHHHHLCCTGLNDALHLMSVPTMLRNLMMAKPMQYLSLELIEAVEAHKTHALYIFQLLRVTDTTDADVGYFVAAMVKAFGERRERWQAMVQHQDTFRDARLNKVAEFVQAFGGLPEEDWQQRLQEGDVEDALANSKKAAQQSSKLKKEDLEKMHTQCTTQAKDKYDCLAGYQAAYKVLTDAAALQDSRVLAYGIQALGAALCVKDLLAMKTGVVIELAPGNGKTFVICLLCKVIELNHPK